MLLNIDTALISWLSGNHPYRVQVAGATLFDVVNGETPPKDNYIITITQFYERTANHFDDVWGRYFDNRSKSILLFLALVEIGEMASGEKLESINELIGLRSDLSHLEELGWVERTGLNETNRQAHGILFDNNIWRLRVGGFVFWLCDVLFFRRNLDGFDSWLNKSISENDVFPKHNWQSLMKWVTPLIKEKSLEYLAQLYSEEFSKG